MKPIHSLPKEQHPPLLAGFRCKEDRSRLAQVHLVNGRAQYMALELDGEEHQARFALMEDVAHLPEPTFFQYIWLDAGNEELPAYCPRCGQRSLQRSEVAELVAQAKSKGKYREYTV